MTTEALRNAAETGRYPPTWRRVARISQSRWHSAIAWTTRCRTPRPCFTTSSTPLHERRTNFCIQMFWPATALHLAASERPWHWQYLLMVAPFGPKTKATSPMSIEMQGTIIYWWLAVWPCQSLQHHQGFFAAPPRWGATNEQIYETHVRTACNSSGHEQCTLFLFRRHPTADARKSTCERTLRGCFRIVQDLRMFTNCFAFSPRVFYLI
jgi:hypothetical protein